MSDITCIKCKYEFKKYKHFIQLEDEENICECCFFDIAIKKFNAKEMQLNGINEIINIKEDTGKENNLINLIDYPY